jgi:hypothetical protein
VHDQHGGLLVDQRLHRLGLAAGVPVGIADHELHADCLEAALELAAPLLRQRGAEADRHERGLLSLQATDRVLPQVVRGRVRRQGRATTAATTSGVAAARRTTRQRENRRRRDGDSSQTRRVSLAHGLDLLVQ